MNFRLAGIDDLDALVRVRLDFFREMFPPRPPEDQDALADTLRFYCRQHLGLDFWAILAEDSDRPAGAAFLNIYERPANPGAPNGRVGELSNVFTYPQYRRQGLATTMVRQLIGVAESLGISRMDLSASETGRRSMKSLVSGRIPGIPACTCGSTRQTTTKFLYK